MPSKHQRGISNKKTRRKANRSWRRKKKQGMSGYIPVIFRLPKRKRNKKPVKKSFGNGAEFSLGDALPALEKLKEDLE